MNVPRTPPSNSRRRLSGFVFELEAHSRSQVCVDDRLTVGKLAPGFEITRNMAEGPAGFRYGELVNRN